ncbi:MAG: chemotaxis protein CheW [Vicingaceae bacterium]|nr:chemotaxis protein CheW [Vicingaceae bacterium]
MSEIEVEKVNKVYSFLSFKLGEEYFVVDVSKVIEILEVPKITKVPKAPEYMAGVINLRGKVLPLIDTKLKFGMPPINFSVDTCIVVIEIELEGEIMHVGVLVDAVLEVIEVDESIIKPSPSIDAKYPLNFIKGMIERGNDKNFIMILDINEVFSLQEKEAIKNNNIN